MRLPPGVGLVGTAAAFVDDPVLTFAYLHRVRIGPANLIVGSGTEIQVTAIRLQLLDTYSTALRCLIEPPREERSPGGRVHGFDSRKLDHLLPALFGTG